MSIVSYAQNYEDVILHRALKDIEFGFYIDIGAQDPVEYSVTKAFYERGWRGINVEPVAHWFEKLVVDRPHDINLQLAAAEKPGNLHLYEILNTGLSTSSAEFARRHIERGFSVHEMDVACITLDEICEQNAVETVHFLKIDCEGSEASVLRGFSFERWRPWIVLVEATEPLSKEPTHLEWESLIVERGYHVIYKDGLNRFYVADEHAELDEAFSYPPNVFDEFVRAAELSVRNELEAARGDLCSLHEARNIGRLEGQLEFLTSENERREAALVEHRRMLDEVGLREALTAERMQAERDKLRGEIEYLRGENERRESALLDSRRLMEEVTQRESENAVRLLDQSQLRDELEFLRGENERREAALVEIRRLLEEACQREAASAAQLRDEQDLSKKEIEYLRSENKRREAALVASRVLLDEATQREAVCVLEVKGQHDLLRQEIEYLHEISLRAATNASVLQRTLDDALRDLDRSRRHLLASEAQRQSAQRQIEIIYSSRSFRLTRPLRYVSRIFRSGLPLISHVLRPGWHHLVRHRWGRRLGLVLFYPFPRLRARIYASIAAHATIQGLSADTLNKPALSPAAKHIHQRLQKKIGKKSG